MHFLSGSSLWNTCPEVRQRKQLRLWIYLALPFFTNISGRALLIDKGIQTMFTAFTIARAKCMFWPIRACTGQRHFQFVDNSQKNIFWKIFEMEMLIRFKLTIPHPIFCEFIKLSLVIFLSIIGPGNNWTVQALHGLKDYPFEQPSQIKGVWQHCTSWLCNHFNCHSDHLINMRE